jgi:hypothetical protein
MTEWEQHLKAMEREETFIKRCYQKLIRMKEARKESRKLEEPVMDMLGSVDLHGDRKRMETQRESTQRNENIDHDQEGWHWESYM